MNFFVLFLALLFCCQSAPIVPLFQKYHSFYACLHAYSKIYPLTPLQIECFTKSSKDADRSWYLRVIYKLIAKESYDFFAKFNPFLPKVHFNFLNLYEDISSKDDGLWDKFKIGKLLDLHTRIFSGYIRREKLANGSDLLDIYLYLTKQKDLNELERKFILGYESSTMFYTSPALLEAKDEMKTESQELKLEDFQLFEPWLMQKSDEIKAIACDLKKDKNLTNWTAKYKLLKVLKEALSNEDI